MKVAVCLSGQPRQDIVPVRDNLDIMKDVFPNADFFLSTWSSCKEEFERVLPGEDCQYYDEPKITYHPYTEVRLDSPPSDHMATKATFLRNENNIQETSKHQTKQILAHAFLADELQHYDILVRTRYDARIYYRADFTEYLKLAWESKMPVGFAHSPRSDFTFPVLAKTRPHFLFDQMIIHRKDIFNTEFVYRLNEEQKLMPAEYGWYQAFGNVGCINVDGWVNPARSVPKQYLGSTR